MSMDIKEYQYQRAKEEKRGHNFAYLTDDVIDQLEKMGYTQHGQDTWSETEAIKNVETLRAAGNYARVFRNATSLRMTKYSVYYRPKKQRESGAK